MSKLSEVQVERVQTLIDTYGNSKEESILHELFALIDIDSSGKIDLNELTTVLNQAFQASIEDSLRAFKEIDANHDGTVDLGEFIALIQKQNA